MLCTLLKLQANAANQPRGFLRPLDFFVMWRFRYSTFIDTEGRIIIIDSAKALFFVYSSKAQENFIKFRPPASRYHKALLLPSKRLSTQPLNMVYSKNLGEVQDGRLP